MYQDMLQVVTLIFIMSFCTQAFYCCVDDVNVIDLLYPTETGALHWLFSLAGAGEEGNASLLMMVPVVVASTASLLPPLLSVDALSSLLPTWTTFSPVFTHLLWPFLFSTSLPLCSPPPSTLPHVSLASGPEDVGATNGRAGGGAEGEETFRTNLIIEATDTLHAPAWLAWL